MKTLPTLLALTASLVVVPFVSAAPESNPGNREPVLSKSQAPVYPDSARSKGVQGTVLMEVLVDESGAVAASEVLKSVHPELDAAALKTVATWTFTPALREGKAVPAVVRVPVRFKLITDDARQHPLLHASPNRMTAGSK